jgi:hypothetical protein
MPGEDADEPALVMVNLAVRATAKEMLMEFFFRGRALTRYAPMAWG